MKIYVLAVLSVFFLNACTSSSLNISDTNKLLLHQGDKTLQISGKVLSRELEWYPRLNISKSKIQNDKGILLHEHVTTELNWEFLHGPIATLQYIFNSYDSDIIHMSTNLALLQLRVNKTDYVNMLVEISQTQELSYVYGFSNEEFISLAKNIRLDSNHIIPKLKYKGLTFGTDDKPLSTWSVKMLFLEPLLKRVMRVSSRS